MFVTKLSYPAANKQPTLLANKIYRNCLHFTYLDKKNFAYASVQIFEIHQQYRDQHRTGMPLEIMWKAYSSGWVTKCILLIY